MKIRLPIAHDPALGFFVDLPTYSMVPGTFAPVIPGVIEPDGVLAGVDPAEVLALGVSVECEVPDEDCDCEAGAPCPQRLAGRYLLKPGYQVPEAVEVTPLDDADVAELGARLAPAAAAPALDLVK